MKYSNVIPGIFLNRPNRFIAEVMIDGIQHRVHVKNTGRCRELLVPGNTVYLEVTDNPERKTKYSLIAVEKRRPAPLLVNMDSQAPNQAAHEWLKRQFAPHAIIRREVTYGKSRFDFCIEDGPRKIFAEVKGVTLEHDGIASFPDAPTERGVKHLRELIQCVADGLEAWVIFIVQMKEITLFRPNDETHPEFGAALRDAAANGVKILVLDCDITPDTMTVSAPVKYEL
jgi:sugar fermentation stimulation protein A